MEDRPTIIYVYDALCGWCYGFSPVIQALHEKYKDQFRFEVVSGGMVRHERVGPIGEVAAYIQDAYRTVEEKTGVTFGPNFLEKTLAAGTSIFDSTPPAKVLAFARELQPDRQIELATTLQRAIYYDGIAPAEVPQYVPYLSDFGIDEAELMAAMTSPAIERLTEADFILTERFGVQGFPTLILQQNEQFYLLSNGYQALAGIEAAIQEAQRLAQTAN